MSKGPEGEASEFFGSRHQLTRALVNEEQIPISSRITAYEDARQIIRNSSFRAVTMCYCRHKKEHLGDRCRKNAPVEGICMVLGEGARFLVRRGFAQERSVGQMLDTLDHTRSLGLTHVTDNVREQPSFICNCCRCCCGNSVENMIAPIINATNYLAVIDADRCIGCGICVEKCHSGAALLNAYGKAHRVKDHCIGCGVCASFCPENAISLLEGQRTVRIAPQRGKSA